MRFIFWSGLGLVGWCYLGYPLLMSLRARFAPAAEGRSRGTGPPATVTVVLAVRNEERRIAERIENLLGQDYPADRLEIVVVSNGSTDGTEGIVAARAKEDARLRLLQSPARDGKAGALNAGVGAARGSVVVFADARQRFEPDVLRRLVRRFGDPSVGAVSGRLRLRASDAPSLKGVGRYWDLETRLRLAESRTGSVVGATGAIYAIRRKLFVQLPAGLILDDVYLPLRIVARGYRVILEPEALAVDRPAGSPRAEFGRKLRTMVGNLQLLRLWPELLVPRKNPVYFRFVSHKLLRLAVPLCLLAVLVAGSALEAPVYRGAVYGQLLFYLLGALGLVLPLRRLSIPAAFLLANAAVVCALLRPSLAAEAVWRPVGSPQPEAPE
ncbi:MAG: glycosyltransferase family 2 protein [Gemmatimonadota bacterium]